MSKPLRINFDRLIPLNYIEGEIVETYIKERRGWVKAQVLYIWHSKLEPEKTAFLSLKITEPGLLMGRTSFAKLYECRKL